jgi:hypothetical protein
MARTRYIQNTRWFVDVSEVNDLAERLVSLSDEATLESSFEQGHKASAKHVFDQARANAAGDRQRASVAASSKTFFHTASKLSGIVALRGGPYRASGEDDPALFAFGSEFGAKRDQTRFVKAKSRIERGQGRVRKRRGRDTENDFGAVRRMVGWNQFDPWRGSANTEVENVLPGYWVWPAVRDSRPVVAGIYGERAMDALRSALDN